MKTNFTLGAAACLVLLVLAQANLNAATLTVTSTADTGNGSLRAALKNSRAGDTIRFSLPAASVITLTSGELLVSKNLTILGPGAGNLAVSGNHASRVFRIASHTTVTIAGLTIAQGFTSGSGGGIYSDHATLIVSYCVVTGNSAANNTGPGVGGGIYSDGTSFQPKAVSATLNVVNCLVTDNFAGNSGGGIASDGGGNVGGPVTATVLDSIVHGNSAGYCGGGIINLGGSTMTVTRSTVSGNAANSASSSLGGGLYNSAVAAVMTVRDSSIIENSALTGGGGIYNSAGTLNVVNSTLSGNAAGMTGDPFTGAGGGIWNYNVGKLSLLNCTLSGNSAAYGSSVAAGGSSQTIGGTILNAGIGGPSIYGNNVTSLGYNLSSDATGALNQPTDTVNTDPLLGPLQDNGGPTWTHAPAPTSPAIDAGKNFSGSASDQRGFARTIDYSGVPNAPDGDGTDIGAVEVQ